MNELKTCPCCGGTPELQGDNFKPTNAGISEYYVQCLGCGLSSGIYKYIDDAINAWNTRIEADEWISIKDRLPEIIEENGSCNMVLVYQKDGFDCSGDIQIWNTKYIHMNECNFTHWMPLKPPKETS